MSAAPEPAPPPRRAPAGVGAAEVLEIAADVWRVLAGAAALPRRSDGELPPAAPPTGAGPRGSAGSGGLRAWVGIEGRWRGLVQLTCSSETAAAMTAAVVGGAVPGTGPPSTTGVDPADLRDVLGELVNVVGGGVKSLVAGSLQLGLPVVIEGARPRTPGQEVLHVDLTWAELPFAITLHALPAIPDAARGATP